MAKCNKSTSLPFNTQFLHEAWTGRYSENYCQLAIFVVDSYAAVGRPDHLQRVWRRWPWLPIGRAGWRAATVHVRHGRRAAFDSRQRDADDQRRSMARHRCRQIQCFDDQRPRTCRWRPHRLRTTPQCRPPGHWPQPSVHFSLTCTLLKMIKHVRFSQLRLCRKLWPVPYLNRVW